MPGLHTFVYFFGKFNVSSTSLKNLREWREGRILPTFLLKCSLHEKIQIGQCQLFKIFLLRKLFTVNLKMFYNEGSCFRDSLRYCLITFFCV